MQGTDLIHRAVLYGEIETLIDLIEEKKIDPSTTDRVCENHSFCFIFAFCIWQNGYQAIHIAAIMGHLEVVKLLVMKYGVKPDTLSTKVNLFDKSCM